MAIFMVEPLHLSVLRCDAHANLCRRVDRRPSAAVVTYPCDDIRKGTLECSDRTDVNRNDGISGTF